MNKNTLEMIQQLNTLGFSNDEAFKLRRIAMTLHTWAEHECNGNIQREGDEGDGVPRWFSSYELENAVEPRGYRIPDRERGAQKRLAKLMKNHPDLWAYEQGDPRGASLYIGRKSDLNGSDIQQTYYRGVAVGR